MFKAKKGQSTLEYIVVFAAIIAAVLVFAYVALKPAVQNVMNQSANKINTSANTFGTTQ